MVKNKIIAVALAAVMFFSSVNITSCSADQIEDEDIKRYAQSMFIEYKVDSMSFKEMKDFLKAVEEKIKENKERLDKESQTPSNTESNGPDLISSIKIFNLLKKKVEDKRRSKKKQKILSNTYKVLEGIICFAGSFVISKYLVYGMFGLYSGIEIISKNNTDKSKTFLEKLKENTTKNIEKIPRFSGGLAEYLGWCLFAITYVLNLNNK